MRRSHAIRKFRPIVVLGPVVVLGTILGSEPARARAQGPSPRARVPVTPRGRFFGPPAVPSPIPPPYRFPAPNGNPYPILPPFSPVLSDLVVTGPVDRCLVNPSPIDPGSLRMAASPEIDPGIFARPRVQGLPIR